MKTCETCGRATVARVEDGKLVPTCSAPGSRDCLRTALDDARAELGEGWFAGGATLAQAIRRKVAMYEGLGEDAPSEVPPKVSLEDFITAYMQGRDGNEGWTPTSAQIALLRSVERGERGVVFLARNGRRTTFNRVLTETLRNMGFDVELKAGVTLVKEAP